MRSKISLTAGLISLALIVFLYGFSLSEGNKDRKNIAVNVTVDNAISAALFNAMTTAWINKGQNYLANNQLNAFNMPIQNFADLLALSPAGTRFYMGLDTTVTPNVPHLILVGVDANGQNIPLYLDNSSYCPPGCSNENRNNANQGAQPAVPNGISATTFNNWTSAWQSNRKEFSQSSLTRYFTMPLANLQHIMTQSPASARLYLGLDTVAKPSEPHLILVGIDGNGNEMNGYYNVTRPCPPGCSE